jgi:MYXO-CTERM domain-containing protein
MDLSLSTAARTLSKGLRTSNPATAALGAALVALLLLRRRREEDGGTLLYRATLRPGKSLEVVLRESAPRRPQALTPDT